MKKLFISIVLLSCLSLAGAQGTVVRKIKIRHADPELIFRLLRGEYPTQPEFSVIFNMAWGWR